MLAFLRCRDGEGTAYYRFAQPKILVVLKLRNPGSKKYSHQSNKVEYEIFVFNGIYGQPLEDCI